MEKKQSATCKKCICSFILLCLVLRISEKMAITDCELILTSASSCLSNYKCRLSADKRNVILVCVN